MLKFDLTNQGNDHPESGNDGSLLSWLADYSLDGGMQLAMVEDLFSVLDSDGGISGFSPVDAPVDSVDGLRDASQANAPVTGADGALPVAGSGYSAGPGITEYVFGAGGSPGNAILTADAEVSFADAASLDGASNGSGNQGGGMPGGDDLIFLDFSSPFAKGGEKGKPGGGGGGGGGGESDPGVLSEYVSGGDSATSYNIKIDFKGTWTADLQQAFIDSADLLSSIITGDIADVFFRGKIIDDIVIKAELKEIDGEGGILGQAGPTAIRTADYLPATAVMQFDIADADIFNGLGLWEEIVTHEMLHSIGFGTIWGYLDLLDTTTDPDAPVFLGESAAAANGDEYVRVEESGGSGTALSHWDEATFGTELMTGWINYDATDPSATTNIDTDLSAMTIASLEDIGYLIA